MINIEINALTNSIQDRITGQEFETNVIEVTFEEIRTLTNWNFDWQKEYNQFKVYKLVLAKATSEIQGLISFQVRKGYVYASLMESAPVNFGKSKKYVGVAGNLIAFACKISFENNNDGFVNFIAKSALIEHYRKTLNAVVISGQNMMIETDAATVLVKRYFKNFKFQ